MSWAVGRLHEVMRRRGIDARVETDQPAEPSRRTVFVAAKAAAPTNIAMCCPDGAEAFTIVPERLDVWLIGTDARGLVYAILELGDRAEHLDDALVAAFPNEAIVGRPANEVRSVTRLFCSETEDKPWFNDEAFWDRYLSMLVGQRFNRFSLTLGLGYNYHRGVTDAYLYFPYPFLVAVPGYDVRVPQIADDEPTRNLEALRRISDAATARSLDFQLGLWNHAFDWIDSPDAHHTIEGLTPDRHAAYCRDALQLLLEECPSIGGVTFRIHGEGGIREGSTEFWRTIFAGVRDAGRPVGIDLHAKGLDETILRLAVDTGQRVTVSPKFWAEHMGPGYHQASIRESERVVRPDPGERSEWHSYMRVSEGSRPFTRYGYADFLREDRDYDVVFRLWAGTQRLLSWGDPAMAAAYGRSAHIAGAQGIEWCEPLTFKGREGSGLPGGRTGYRDALIAPGDDYAKFAYAYRLFGRLTYDPEAPAESWRRAIPPVPSIDSALATASRILPLITVAHHPSASNNYYWPELYTDMPIMWTAEGTRPHPYSDTPEPHRFGNVGPLDPEVFSSVVDHVRETLDGRPSGRISPMEVATRLEAFTAQASAAVASTVHDADVETRRWRADIAILAGLGGFFAGKLRAAVWYELFASTGNDEAIRLALEAYRSARDAWIGIFDPSDVYVADLTFGPQRRLRGHWRDRLEAIDADLADMERRAASSLGSDDRLDASLRSSLVAVAAQSPDVRVAHDAPESFVPGEPVEIAVQLDGASVSRVELRFRPMNQALRISTLDMVRSADGFTAKIPAEVADGVFPLAYAFVVHEDGHAWRHPTIGADLASRPYHVIRPTRR